jgi:hypothetical protein
MILEDMYEGKVNSPTTFLVNDIDHVQTEIEIADISVLPKAPNLISIGSGELTETVRYEGVAGNTLTGCTRGFQGIAKAWNKLTVVARLVTEYDLGSLQRNVETLSELQNTKANITSPNFLGVPTAPTAGATVNNTQIATTAFVKTEVAKNWELTTIATDTYTVAPSELQALINSLPRLLNRNVTINVTEGMTTDNIIISKFYGNGWFRIYGYKTGIKVTVKNIRVEYCSCDAILIDNFICNNTSDNTVSCTWNNTFVQFSAMTIALSSSGRGIYVYACSGTVLIGNCIISNQNIAIEAGHSYNVTSSANSGVGNNYVFSATPNSKITLSGTFPSGTTIASRSKGGVIINDLGDKIGDLLPHTDNAYSLGSATLRFKQIYASSSTISTSDENQKEHIKPLDTKKTKEFIMSLNPVSYEFKGNDYIRTHHGLIAQDVETAMHDNGLNSLDFAGLCISPIIKEVGTGEFLQTENENEEPIEITKPEITGMSYGLRYEEFIAPIIKMVQMQQKEIEELKVKIGQL